MLEGSGFEIIVEIGSATGHRSGVRGDLRGDGLSSAKLQQEVNPLACDFGGGLSRPPRFLVELLVHFLGQRDMEIRFRRGHVPMYHQICHRFVAHSLSVDWPRGSPAIAHVLELHLDSVRVPEIELFHVASHADRSGDPVLL